MESEMTTAEMVEYMRDEAGKIGLVADALRGGAPTSARVADSRSANYAAIADRLEALDKVATMLYDVMTDKSETPSVVMTFDRARQWMEFRSAMKDVGHDPLPPLPAADAHDAASELRDRWALLGEVLKARGV